MNADRLLEHFERISDAADAVPRLRRFVLNAAATGNLVAADLPGHSSHEEHAEAFSGERWAEVTLGELTTQRPICYGVLKPGPRQKTGVPLIRITDMNSGVVNDSGLYLITQQLSDEFRRSVLNGGEILLSIQGTIGRVAICPSHLRGANISRTLALIDPDDRVYRPFLRYWLMSNEGSFPTCGATRDSLNIGAIRQLRMPLPPLAEQHRIVAKVDELMALCDRLEAAQAEREARRDRLVSASLARVIEPDSDDATSTATSARFHLDHFARLTTRPEHVKQLRQTILNLAVRGCLVPHNEIWQRKTFSELCPLITSGSRGWAAFYAKSGAAFIRAQNIRFGMLRLDDLAYVAPPATAETQRCRLQKGDLLVVITGAGVTTPACVDRDLGEAYVSQHVALSRPADANFSPWLLLCLMATQGCRGQLVQRAYGAGKPGLNLDNIRTLEVSLPPLAEQRRIVAKVDELMALCDQLDASLASASTDRVRLLEALLHEALAPAA